jgi:hypothetical protein
MQLLSFLTLAGVAVASLSQGSKRSASFNELTGIMERQLRICDRVPVGPNFCERSCGTGFVSCVNESTCYNPTIGDVCCSDGSECLIIMNQTYHHHLLITIQRPAKPALTAPILLAARMACRSRSAAHLRNLTQLHLLGPSPAHLLPLTLLFRSQQ